MAHNNNSFEAYLSHIPPNYEQEWNATIWNLALTCVIFIFIVPIVANGIFATKAPTNHSKESSSSSIESSPPPVLSTTKRSKKGKSKNGKSKASSSGALDNKNSSSNNANSDETVAVVEVPGSFFPIINLIFLLCLIIILSNSPNNKYAARRVYVAPLLREEECQQIIHMAEAAASRNAKSAQLELDQILKEEMGPSSSFMKEQHKDALEKLLKEPSGWKKDRHDNYPTTDLNVVIGFEREDKLVLKRLLDARLTPILERTYGVSRDSIRANDMFVVRYDGDGQQALIRHTDSSHISFNVLLNNDFVGGGTRFHNRKYDTYTDVKAKRGEVLINNAMVAHEGLATTEGTRYIFVGFMSVDRMNPMTGVQSGLSLFSSWLSFPWLTVTIKEGLEVKVSTPTAGSSGGGGSRSSRGVLQPILSNDYYINGFLQQSIQLFAKLGDAFAPHEVSTLVENNHYEDFINALEDDYGRLEREGFTENKANWFEGQQINIGLDGLMGNEWQNRAKNKEAFNEDL